MDKEIKIITIQGLFTEETAVGETTIADLYRDEWRLMYAFPAANGMAVATHTQLIFEREASGS